MDLLSALGETFDQSHAVIGRVQPTQYGNATPCSEWDVQMLLTHMIGVVAHLGATAGGLPSDGVAAFKLADDPAPQFRALADRALAAWSRPGVLDATLHGGAGPMPGSGLASINLIDTATHAWDLARATGQQIGFSEPLAQFANETAHKIIVEPLRPGRFGPEVTVAANASSLDRLVAFLGRVP